MDLKKLNQFNPTLILYQIISNLWLWQSCVEYIKHLIVIYNFEKGIFKPVRAAIQVDLITHSAT